jgi:hypothetical protein
MDRCALAVALGLLVEGLRRQIVNGPAVFQQTQPGFFDESHAAALRPCQLYESYLPAQFHQRDSLALKRKLQLRGSASQIDPSRRVR